MNILEAQSTQTTVNLKGFLQVLHSFYTTKENMFLRTKLLSFSFFYLFIYLFFSVLLAIMVYDTRVLLRKKSCTILKCSSLQTWQRCILASGTHSSLVGTQTGSTNGSSATIESSMLKTRVLEDEDSKI